MRTYRSHRVSGARRRSGGSAHRTPALLAVLCAGGLTFAPTALASTKMQINVVNDRGVPQPGVGVYHNGVGPNPLTDDGGSMTLTIGSDGDVAEGSTIQISREVPFYAGDPCAAPEGAGITYTIPEPPPASVTITVPSLRSSTDPAFEPSLSNPELKLLGLMNDLRVSMGHQPLEISTVLTGVADRYLSEVSTHTLDPANPDTFHCIVSSPMVRAEDVGFPDAPPPGGGAYGVGENGYGSSTCSTAQDVYDAYYAEKGTAHAGHYQNMIDPHYTTVGIATNGPDWVIDLSLLDLSSPFVGRAALTGQTGDSSLPDANCGEGSGGGGWSGWSHRQNPRLHLRAKARGAVLRLRLRLRWGAQGKLSVVAERSRAARLVRVRGSGTIRHAVLHLAPGRWRLVVRFTPTSGSGWRSAVLHRSVFIR